MPIRVVVNIFGQLLVNGVSFDWDVDSDTGLKVDNVGAQLFDLVLLVFQLLQHVKLCGLRIVEFLFELNNVRRCTLKLFLKFSFGCLHRVVVLVPHCKLCFDIFFLSKTSVTFKNLGIFFRVVSFKSLYFDIHLVDAKLVL